MSDVSPEEIVGPQSEADALPPAVEDLVDVGDL